MKSIIVELKMELLLDDEEYEKNLEQIETQFDDLWGYTAGSDKVNTGHLRIFIPETRKLFYKEKGDTKNE